VAKEVVCVSVLDTKTRTEQVEERDSKAELQERDSGADIGPPIAHIRSPIERRGLCGAELLGIRAFGDYVVCEECQRIKRESGFEWHHQDVPF
jgi:hypothetical protein